MIDQQCAPLRLQFPARLRVVENASRLYSKPFVNVSYASVRRYHACRCIGDRDRKAGTFRKRRRRNSSDNIGEVIMVKRTELNRCIERVGDPRKPRGKSAGPSISVASGIPELGRE